MALPARWRKLVLTAHITTSVGWLGAVLAYVALDVAAITSTNPDTVRALWVARDVTVWSAIVPLAVASVLIGIVNALGTPWGLLRHYWVIMKLLLTLAATAILLQEAQSVSAAAAQARADPRPGSLLHSVGGLVVLLTVTTLSVFKPRGLTRYGWRRQQQHGTRSEPRVSAGVQP
jgi:ribose/xylose/arabinose/galactoside ABC-type transport system permease subunit